MKMQDHNCCMLTQILLKIEFNRDVILELLVLFKLVCWIILGVGLLLAYMGSWRGLYEQGMEALGITTKSQHNDLIQGL